MKEYYIKITYSSSPESKYLGGFDMYTYLREDFYRIYTSQDVLEARIFNSRLSARKYIKSMCAAMPEIAKSIKKNTRILKKLKTNS